MPHIEGIATCVPKNKIYQEDARRFAGSIFGSHRKDIERLLPVFENSGIDCRYFSKPIEWFSDNHTLAEKNNTYIESATSLGLEASSIVMQDTGTKAENIDYIIYVNTTGLATPTIDARLINLLNLRSDIRRTPIWGLGCAGGAAGLSTAYHYLLGHPDQKVLLVAIELCGLTFMSDDFSQSNLVATALFGEGAAAVIISGDEVKTKGLEIIGTNSRFFPDSLDVMGWNVENRGLQVVFAKRIPSIVEEMSLNDLSGFLQKHELTLSNIDVLLFHPGGRKVIEAYEKALGVDPEKLNICREILREYGNMSSVTVLFVLERFFKKYPAKNGYGLVSSLGPGFCSESLLLKF